MSASLLPADAARVAVVRADYDDELPARLRALFDLIPGALAVRRERIVVKINLCDVRGPETGAITHPRFLEACLRVFRERQPALPIYVVESDATVVLPDLVRDWYGFGPLLQRWEAQWLNLTRAPQRVAGLSGRVLREVRRAEIFDGAYFVSLAKMKTNSLSTITACLKNQFGCLPEVEKVVYHPRLADVIVDVNRVFRPDLCLVDGVVGQGGGQGPSFGAPIHSRLVVAGRDPVTVDAACARLMGFEPRRIAHIVRCARAGLGRLDAPLVGDTTIRPDRRYRPTRLERATVEWGQAFKTFAVRRWRHPA